MKSRKGIIGLLLLCLLMVGVSWAQERGVVAGAAVPPADYRISPNDKLSVSVYEEPDLSVDVSVSSNGMVTLPLIEQVKVVGKTTREVETAVIAAYRDQQFLRNPQITITIMEFAQRTVSVLGQVNKPGQVPIPPGQTRIELLSAIALAGDFKGIANKKKVRVTRNKGQRGEKSTTVNVGDLLDADKGVQTLYLYPGDIVIVPQRIF